MFFFWFYLVVVGVVVVGNELIMSVVRRLVVGVVVVLRVSFLGIRFFECMGGVLWGFCGLVWFIYCLFF